MNIFHFFKKHKKYKSIPFVIFIAFLISFIISRLFTSIFPETSLNVRGIHVHHLAYGIILMSILGYISLVNNLSYHNRLRLSFFYGIALGLAYDEFAMWIQLEDVYHSRTNYDAVLTVSLLMLSTIFFPGFWQRWGHRGQKLSRIILSSPKALFKLLKEQFT